MLFVLFNAWGSHFPSGCLWSAPMAPPGRCFVPESAGTKHEPGKLVLYTDSHRRSLQRHKDWAARKGACSSDSSSPTRWWDKKKFSLSTVEPCQSVLWSKKEQIAERGSKLVSRPTPADSGLRLGHLISFEILLVPAPEEAEAGALTPSAKGRAPRRFPKKDRKKQPMRLWIRSFIWSRF